jgi:hypothetical protein
VSNMYVDDEVVARSTSTYEPSERYVRVKAYESWPMVNLSISLKPFGRARCTASLTIQEAIDLAECLVEAARACAAE